MQKKKLENSSKRWYRLAAYAHTLHATRTDGGVGLCVQRASGWWCMDGGVSSLAGAAFWSLLA